MADHLFSDHRLASLYDALCPRNQRADFDFYLPMVMAAEAVLDIGCGTGAMLHEARQAGHIGRLCGLDPALGMLAQARRRLDIDWVQSDLASMGWEGQFDLIVMTGHAFQVLVSDDELRAFLAAVRAALTKNGRFAFETRNPTARAWEGWTPEHITQVADADGATVQMVRQVVEPFDGDIVSFTHTFTSATWARAEVSRSTLRFLGAQVLGSFLAEAGLATEAWFGDWDRQPLTAASPEIIVIVRRA